VRNARSQIKQGEVACRRTGRAHAAVQREREGENGDARLGVSVFERIAGCALLAGSGLGVYRIQ
jgi:hypothetical protein